VNIKNIAMDDIDRFIKEDVGDEGDITSNSLFNHETACAYIISKERCIVAGLEETKIIFKKTGACAKLLVNDGDFIKEKTKVIRINGPIRSILMGERLSLNIISRMSGIASETKKIIDKCKHSNPKIIIAATRKTTPGFRKFEKKAVIIGGGKPHRYGLYDAVLIKDNHIKFTGSVKESILRIKQNIKDKIIEIEVENEKDAILAAKMKVDIIMLDNLSPRKAKELSNKIRDIDKNILIEISGNITQNNIIKYASFADIISLGYLTHSIKSKDFSLDLY
jgi:nicotinate-nucleotide pyrophosphorylase (carboxylating)